MRWQLNLWRQLDMTRFQYAGKSWEDKRLAAEDGRLFAFMREAKAKIGDAPAHVFVFCGRGISTACAAPITSIRKT